MSFTDLKIPPQLEMHIVTACELAIQALNMKQELQELELKRSQLFLAANGLTERFAEYCALDSTLSMLEESKY
jgi:hypothetical protein